MEPSRQLAPSDVTIIVPVGGAAPAWDRAARSLARLDPPPSEIVVVLDGPNEALAARTSELDARVVQLEEQGGPARARNWGAQVASGTLLFFLDSDIEVPEDLVAQLTAQFPSESPPAAVIGSYDDAPGDPAFLSQYRNLQHHFVHQTGREEASTFWSGCGTVRRAAFLEVGGFDESYAQPSIEDIELGARLIRAGHSIRLVKDLQVKHLKRWGLWDMLTTDLWRRAVPWSRLMLESGELVNDLNVKTRDRLSVMAAFLAPIALLAWLWLPLLGLGAAAITLMIGLNAGFFAFLHHRRGFLFAAASIPVYWVYLLICGLGFAIALFSVKLLRWRRAP